MPRFDFLLQKIIVKKSRRVKNRTHFTSTEKMHYSRKNRIYFKYVFDLKMKKIMSFVMFKFVDDDAIRRGLEL